MKTFTNAEKERLSEQHARQENTAEEDAEALFDAIFAIEVIGRPFEECHEEEDVILYQRLNALIQEKMNIFSLGEFLNRWDETTEFLTQARRATKRHAENRAMKKEVFAWLDSNMSSFKSMDAAASAIETKVAPIAWRTARDWVAEWKKVRSAGTT